MSGGGIRTATLAEIYARQGHLTEACGIYEELAAQRPDDPALAARLVELRQELRLRAMDEGRRSRVEGLRSLLHRVQRRRRSA
ncbi:MAG: tetratricopeptide repeat protein [Deltaproteobacteria bacterium]|nr:tetratricopeptide repeat protein [Deltaproteobacteria bacterium]MCB9788455.1 tetratricopeptide repeat protein [Deltaproteobacteria bacterium]